MRFTVRLTRCVAIGTGSENGGMLDPCLTVDRVSWAILARRFFAEASAKTHFEVVLRSETRRDGGVGRMASTGEGRQRALQRQPC